MKLNLDNVFWNQFGFLILRILATTLGNSIGLFLVWLTLYIFDYPLLIKISDLLYKISN